MVSLLYVNLAFRWRATAFENTARLPLSQELDRDDRYTYRRGGQFVNEYGRRDATTGDLSAGTPADPHHLLGTFLTLFPYGAGGFETL